MCADSNTIVRRGCSWSPTGAGYLAWNCFNQVMVVVKSGRSPQSTLRCSAVVLTVGLIHSWSARPLSIARADQPLLSDNPTLERNEPKNNCWKEPTTRLMSWPPPVPAWDVWWAFLALGTGGGAEQPTKTRLRKPGASLGLVKYSILHNWWLGFYRPRSLQDR